MIKSKKTKMTEEQYKIALKQAEKLNKEAPPTRTFFGYK